MPTKTKVRPKSRQPESKPPLVPVPCDSIFACLVLRPQRKPELAYASSRKGDAEAFVGEFNQIEREKPTNRVAVLVPRDLATQVLGIEMKLPQKPR